MFLVFLMFSGQAFAAGLPPLTEKTVGLPDQALVSRVQNYLNSIETLEADFGQATIGNDVSSGKFYLQRGHGNGKFRWEYIKGQQVLIISNGTQIVYYDKKLDEVTYIPMQYGVAGFLADDNIKFSGDVKLVSASDDGKETRIIVTQEKKPDEGRLALYFADEPMKLTHMEAIDQDGNITAIVFKNQKFNEPISKEKFVFKDPKFYKDVWDKK